VHVPKPNGSQQTLAVTAENWLAVYIATARSAKNVSLATQRVDDFLIPFMGDREVASIQPDDVRRYRLALEHRGLSGLTVRHVLSDLRCQLGWCVEGGLIARSPFPRRVMPRIQEMPTDRLSPEDLAAVLAIPEPQAFVVRLGIATGLRWSELCRARAEDVQDGWLIVSHTKSGRLRRIPLSKSLADEIHNHVGRLVPYALPSHGNFARFVRHHSGVARFHAHQMRHTFACRWLERGGSLAALQQMLGHASVVTTQRYARLGDEHVRRQAEHVFGATVSRW